MNTINDREPAFLKAASPADYCILKSAHFTALGEWAPAYTSSQYEDQMLSIAKREARKGESPAVAFARLCEDRDPRIESLFVASRRADHDARREAVLKRRKDEAPEQQQRPMTVREKVMADMLSRAQREKRDDETEEQAMSRLIDSDRKMQDLYKQYMGW